LRRLRPILETVGRRLLQLIPVVIGISLVAFALVHMTPGDPARGLVPAQLETPQILRSVRHQLGLDQPLIAQYGNFVWKALHGNLGYSFRLHANVDELVASHLPITLFLLAYTGVLTLVLGVPLALFAALRHNKWQDNVIRTGLVISFSLPAFWVGVLLIGFVALRTGIFPSAGYGSGSISHLWHLFLPALTLSLTFLAVLVRNLRVALVEVLEIDYVALARLKGLSRIRLYWSHIIRNAIAPAITILGLNLSFLLGATVVVESVFAVQGIGYVLVQGVLARDYQLVQGLALLFGIIVIGITLLVDVSLVILDPRRWVTPA
jgi:peptide/nickel transport system permease protein